MWLNVVATLSLSLLGWLHVAARLENVGHLGSLVVESHAVVVRRVGLLVDVADRFSGKRLLDIYLDAVHDHTCR